jgi:hypothetical protein
LKYRGVAFLKIEGPATDAKEVGLEKPAEEIVLLLDNYL